MADSMLNPMITRMSSCTHRASIIEHRQAGGRLLAHSDAPVLGDEAVELDMISAMRETALMHGEVPSSSGAW